MKMRSPKSVFILVLIFNVIVFAYINFCPSVGHVSTDQNYLVNVSQEILKLPEMEIIVKACKMVISFIFP